MQRGCETLPRILRGAVVPGRIAIGFLTDADQPANSHCGRMLTPGDIVVNDSDAMHRRSDAPCRWGGMSLSLNDFAAAGKAMSGRQLAAPSHAWIVRPSHWLMSRLLNLHEQAGKLAKTAPDMFADPQVARALDQALVHAMVMCLTENMQIDEGGRARRHSDVIARFEEFLTANEGEPVYLAEICAATGATERTLRACCQEYFGMGAIRYLWLRRMHMAHRALIQSTAGTTTVTDIATGCGFWEFGRFAVEYRALFGEPPSVSLRRPALDQQPCHGGSLVLAA
jgi:AraC-like DNA-binding protein